jgi:ribosomal protein S7
MTQGSYQKSFNSKISIEDALSSEILNAYNLSQQSVAIAKKLELERQADSSR